MCVLSLISSYVGSVQYFVSLLFASVCFFCNYLTLVFNITFMFVFLFCIFVFCFVYSVLLYCFVCFFPVVYISLFRIFVQVNQPLPPGRNPIALNCNKCRAVGLS